MSPEFDELVVRLITEEDWKILKTVRLESLLDSPDVFAVNYATAEKYSESEWRDRASQNFQNQYILAIKGNRAIGIIGATQNAVHEFNVIAMWVNPMFRGRGIADLLISAIKNLAISKGHSRIVLSVSPRNERAVCLYARHDFVFIPEWESLALSSGERNQKMECVFF
ncbi:GNAT family N-acetyltransferase [Acinetobacter sp. Tr-809]|uniref:GNAT family N-acetyltransferase n=1 Tax=Acinetobacter sp. Tr-809 TaxID=2608324 RepID=UPI00141D8E2F|nr:GNAT family N-acetyltransferase [Acinetobacter sp. Tr-809]NIE96237.1 GNAT family N-acetyltransferase [Acinetobacter sp. Tr-809]